MDEYRKYEPMLGYMMWWDMSDSGISENYTDYPNYKHTDYSGYICEWDE